MKDKSTFQPAVNTKNRVIRSQAAEKDATRVHTNVQTVLD